MYKEIDVSKDAHTHLDITKADAIPRKLGKLRIVPIFYFSPVVLLLFLPQEARTI